MTEQEVDACTILRGVVGSTAHGVNVNDGADDRDEMGVCIEPLTAAMGVGAPFEQYIYRSAAEREGKHDARSGPGDLDLTVFSLRKYVRLALKGNPTVLLLLFTPPTVADARGYQLRELAPAILSREAGKAFLGYLHAQRQRLTGERGQKRIHRPELEALYSFDTKYAMHALRLGIQGVELMTTGTLSLPMQEPARSYLLGVRTGKETYDACLTRMGELEAELRDLLQTSILPPTPNVGEVEQWMTRLYIREWSAARRAQDVIEDAAVGLMR